MNCAGFTRHSEAEMGAYKDAGVDIAEGNRAVALAKRKIESTFRHWPGKVLGGVGAFAALLERPSGEIVGVSCDGVGTKLLVGILLGRHETVGQDLIAMCFNDLAVEGITEELVFLDYIGMGKQVPERTDAVIGGIVDGCHAARATLAGGEMAEMPGMYSPSDYDLAGFAMGFAHGRDALMAMRPIERGMKVWGLPSSGLHSNGYSLVRKIFLPDRMPEEAVHRRLGSLHGALDCTLGEALMKPTRIYVEEVRKILRTRNVARMVHITGGGLVENPPRVLPEGYAIRIRGGSWPVPPIFSLLQHFGRISAGEMCRTFNMGLGLLVISPDEIPDAYRVGEVVESPIRETQFV